MSTNSVSWSTAGVWFRNPIPPGVQDEITHELSDCSGTLRSFEDEPSWHSQIGIVRHFVTTCNKCEFKQKGYRVGKPRNVHARN